MMGAPFRVPPGRRAPRRRGGGVPMSGAPTDPNLPTFRDLALRLRGRAGLTQRELAAGAGVSERAIQTWEAGLSYPSAQSLQRLIALYLARGAFGAGRERAEAAALWAAALAEAPRLNAAFDPDWFAGLLAGAGDRAGAPAPAGARRQDWGEAPAAAAFHGRVPERETLTRWLVAERCRLVGVLGIGGVGKTALAAAVARELAPEFDSVHWRSLRNAPPCAEWLGGAILSLSGQQVVPPEGEGARLLRLLELLRERRGLLVLDNLETVLEPGAAEAQYREGYAGYGLALRSGGGAGATGWGWGGGGRGRTRAGCSGAAARRRPGSGRRGGGGRRCGRCAWAGSTRRPRGRC